VVALGKNRKYPTFLVRNIILFGYGSHPTHYSSTVYNNTSSSKVHKTTAQTEKYSHIPN
jgi:hypothetical protein